MAGKTHKVTSKRKPAEKTGRAHITNQFYFYILLAAAVIRVVFFIQWESSPYSLAPVVDGWEYHTDAIAIAHYGVPHWNTFWHPPLYPYFLGLLYLLAGSSKILIPVIVQQFIGLISIYITMKITDMLFGRNTAIVTGIITGFYPLLICFESLLLTPVLEILFNLVMIWRILQFESQGNKKDLIFAGFFFGLSSITRPVILICLPFILFFLVRKTGEPANQQPSSLARQLNLLWFFLIPAGMTIFPVTWWNHHVSGEWVLISTNGGINFYLGNNPESDKTIAMRPGSEWSALIARHSSGTDAQISNRWFAEGLKFWKESPMNALRTTAIKFYRLFHYREIMRNQDYSVIRNEISLLQLPWFNFGSLFALSFAGWLVSPKSRPRFFLTGIFCCYSISIILFFVTARYRTPLIPLMAIFAGEAIRWGYEQITQRRKSRVIVTASVVIMLTIITHWPITASIPPETIERDNFINLADIYERAGVPAKSMEYLELLKEKFPGFPDSYLRIGVIKLREQDYSSAEKLFKEAHRLAPESPLPFIDLGLVSFQTGRFDDAEAFFKKARDLNQKDPSVHLYLAQTLARTGQPFEESMNECIRWSKSRLAHYPQSAELNSTLGKAYLLKNDLPSAAKYLERATEINPGDSESWEFLVKTKIDTRDIRSAEKAVNMWIKYHPRQGKAYDMLGTICIAKSDYLNALTAYSKAVQLDPGNPDFHNRLAVAYLATGNTQMAKEHALEAQRQGYQLHSEMKQALGMD